MITYEQALEYVNGYSKSGEPVKDLSRFTALMQLLDNPHNSFKSVHIAGTNGKGSTCEYISNSLIQSGKTVGKFTSPYITCIEERIQVNNRNISRPAFAVICEQVKNAVEESNITGYSQFEILTAIGFLYFCKEQVDYAVIETGIGGTLDCTNVITPLVSVITSVDYDHTALLGETIPEIASHKAGIIKPSIPCVSSILPHSAEKVVADRCAALGSEYIISDTSRLSVMHIDARDVFFSYKGMNYHLVMSGEHQIMNAMCAIDAGKKLGLDYLSIFTGLEKSSLPARMEKMSRDGIRYIVDGSHNPAAMKAAKELLAFDKHPIYAVIGMLDSKDWQSALSELLPAIAEVIFIDGFADGSVPSNVLMEFAASTGCKCSCEKELKAAIELACEKARNGKGYVLVTGSLYLASEARKIIKE